MPEENESLKPSKKNAIWYVLGAAAGLGLYLWYRNYQNNQTLAATQNALANEPSGASNSTTNVGASPITSTISTLSDWMTQAQQWLDGQGYDAATVQNALQAYSQGTCLTSQEFQYLDKALGQFGMPPDAPFQGLVQCPQTSPPSTTPNKPPATGPGSAQARAAYDQALANYRAVVNNKGASNSVIEKLYLDVVGTQALYQGVSGTSAARAKYDQALNAYRQAAAGKANYATLQQLQKQVDITQAAYVGHG